MSETTGSIDCPACDMSFDSREELERHSRLEHAKGKPARQDNSNTE